MASRYGNGGNGHGRRVIGDDAPLEEPMVGEVEKGVLRGTNEKSRRKRRVASDVVMASGGTGMTIGTLAGGAKVIVPSALVAAGGAGYRALNSEQRRPRGSKVAKKKRTYDPQDRRMRRLGNYEAGLAVGGAAAGGVGVHGVRQDSKKLEGLTVRGKPTKPDTKAIHVLGSKKPPVLVSRRNAALLATGGAGLAGAGSLRRYANGDGGRRWH